jgi:hypothetical protein
MHNSGASWWRPRLIFNQNQTSLKSRNKWSLFSWLHTLVSPFITQIPNDSPSFLFFTQRRGLLYSHVPVYKLNSKRNHLEIQVAMLPGPEQHCDPVVFTEKSSGLLGRTLLSSDGGSGNWVGNKRGIWTDSFLDLESSLHCKGLCTMRSWQWPLEVWHHWWII